MVKKKIIFVNIKYMLNEYFYPKYFASRSNYYGFY